MKNICKALALPLMLLLWAAACAFTVLPRTDYRLCVYADDRKYVFTYPEIDVCSGRLYLKDADAVIERIFLDTAVYPRDARIFFHPNQKKRFTVTAERAGRFINKPLLKRQMLEALEHKQGEVTAKFISAKPDITAAQLYPLTSKRAEFFTLYPSSSSARKHNINLACCAINGTFLKNGEQFSFNAAVGERTHERGYRDSKVILNGSFTEGVGGGVCQASTTVYNCAVLAGMDIDERHPHSLAVGYVEPSFDAMVSATSDLRFTNTSGGTVFIEATADGERLTVTIFGLKMPFRIERSSELLSVEDSGYNEIADTTGELCGDSDQKIITPSVPTVKSRARITVTENGRVRSFTLSTDTYRGRRGVIAKRIYIKTP